MQTVQPAKNHLFCKPHEAETKTKSGLLLPGEAATIPSIAEVINVGEGVPYASGSKVVYKTYASHDIKLNGDEYLLLALEDVLGEVVDA